jgi:hypothetical protein
VTGLYLMMGRALERLEAVPAGNVAAIAGLQEAVLKSGTIVSTPAAPALAQVTHQAEAIVQARASRRSCWNSRSLGHAHPPDACGQRLPRTQQRMAPMHAFLHTQSSCQLHKRR